MSDVFNMFPNRLIVDTDRSVMCENYILLLYITNTSVKDIKPAPEHPVKYYRSSRQNPKALSET